MYEQSDEKSTDLTLRDPSVLAARTLSFDEVMAANRRDAGPSQDYGPLVREIRDRLRALARREVQLTEREAEVQRRLATLDASTSEASHYGNYGADLESRRQELDRLSRDLHERRVKLDTTEAELIDRAAELGTLQQQLSRSVDWIQQRKAADRKERVELRQAMKAWHQRHDSARAALRNRISIVRDALNERQRELEQLAEHHSEEWAASQERIAEIEKLAGQLEQRESRLQEDLENLDRKAKEVAVLEAELDKRDAHVSARESAQAASASEFEQQLADLVERQRELETRQQELDQRESEFATKIDEHESSSATQQRELHDQAEELRSRGELLAEREQLFSEREAQLRVAEEEVVVSQTEATQQRTQLERERQQLNNRELEISARMAELTQREMELEQNKAALGEQMAAAKDQDAELQIERQALIDERSELEVLSQSVEQSEESIEFRRFLLEEKTGEMEERERDLDSLQARLDAQSVELASQEGSLHQTEQQLEQARASEEAARESQREHLARQREELEARQSTLDESQDALEHQQRILDEKRMDLEERSQQLSERQSELEKKKTELDSWKGELSETEGELAQRRADHEQSMEALVAERAELETERVLLDEERAELDTAREAQMSQLEAAVEKPASVPTPAPVPVVQPLVHSWPRTILIGVMGGGLAAALVWMLETPRYHVRQGMRVVSERSETATVLGEHLAGLSNVHRTTALSNDPNFAEAWEAALQSGTLSLTPEVELSAIDILHASAAPADSARLVGTAADHYAEQVNAQPDELVYPPEYAVRAARQEKLKTDRAEISKRIAEYDQQLAAMPVAADRDAAAKQLDSLRQQHAASNAELVALREQRLELERDRPPVVVPEANLIAALEADPVYQQDVHEFRVSAHAYQRQLAQALLSLEEPFNGFEARFGELNGSLAEQRQLSPPPAIRSALDRLSEVMDPMQAQFKLIRSQRPGWVQALQQLDPESETATMIEIHNAGDDAHRQLIDQAASLIQTLNTAAAELGQTGSGGARQRVLASLLRSDARDLTDVAAAMNVAARELSISDNFELDSYSRKVRGLRTRINRRRGETEQRLQLQAGMAASTEHSEALERIASRTKAVERVQQTLLVQITEQWETQQQLDLEVARRRLPELDREAQQRRLALLDEELAGLASEIEQLASQAIHPDRIEAGPAQQATTIVAGGQRGIHSALAGLGVGILLAGLNWLLSGRRQQIQAD